jgi:uncharacterized membrane protein
MMVRVALGLGLLVLIGCASSTTSNGKPQPPFRLVPGLSERAEVLLGTDQEFEVKVERRGDFSGPIGVQVEVQPAGKGVTARVEEKTITSRDQPIKLIVSVTETAQSGDYTARIVGKANGEAEGSAELLLRVPRRD